MHASISLGKIAGIPIGLHYSWLVIATLITVSLGVHFGATNPAWSTWVVWLSATITALLFFASLIAHELSHALVARARDLPVRSITLFALGGVAQIEKDATSARSEFFIAIVGPITSVVIGLACIAAAQAMGWTFEGGAPGPFAAILGWLGSINVVLALFNLIPGYPLDGGRVLRSILWGVYGDADRATRYASYVGQFVAGLFIVFGVMRFFSGGDVGGLWLAFIGWFLLNAAQASAAEVAIASSLRGVRAGDVMTRDCDTVSGRTALDALADLVLRSGRRCFMVTRDDGEVVGLITPQEMRKVDRRLWPESRVADAMRPLQSLRTLNPATPVSEALQIMTRDDVNQLPVMSDGHLAGVLTRSHVLHLVQARAELGR